MGVTCKAAQVPFMEAQTTLQVHQDVYSLGLTGGLELCEDDIACPELLEELLGKRRSFSARFLGRG